MKIAQEYSHLNGKEYLIVHHRSLLREIYDVINIIDASQHKTKVSREKSKIGKFIYNPASLNQNFKDLLYEKGWHDKRRDFYVSTDPNIVKQLEPLDFKEQKLLLQKINHPLFDSYNQTDFVQNKSQ
jgi:hypothetical protein